MDLLGRRLFRVALVALALAGGSGVVWADGTMPGNSDVAALPALVPHSTQDSLLLAGGSSSLGAPPQKFDLPSGRLDFFSPRPESSSGDFM